MNIISSGSSANVTVPRGQTLIVNSSVSDFYVVEVGSGLGRQAGEKLLAGSGRASVGPFDAAGVVKVSSISGTTQADLGADSDDYVNTDPDSAARQREFERLLSVNNASFNGIGDDQPALYYATQALARSGYMCGVTLPRGVSSGKLSSTWEVDMTLASVNALWTKFDCTSITGTNAAIKLTGTEETLTNVVGRNKMGGIRNFELVGPSESGTTIGVNLEGVTTDLGPGPGRIVLERFLVHNFGTGIQHHHHAFGECVQHGDINNCGTGVLYNPGGLSKDMGELTKYFDVFVYQCLNWGWDIQGVHGTWFKADKCHSDHNQRQVRVMRRARGAFVNCHFEAADYQAGAPFLLDSTGGMIELVDGEHVLTGGSPAMPFYIENNAPRNGHHGVFIKGRPNFYKLTTTSGYLATGSGLTRVTDGFSSNVDISSAAVRNPRYISANALDAPVPDRGFDASTLLRRVQITQDTASITSPVTGTNITLARSTAAPRSAVFVGRIDATTLTYTSGDVPYVGMALSGSGVTACTITGTGTTSTTYTVSVSQTVAAGTTITGAGVGHLRATKAGAAATVAEFWVPAGKIRDLNQRGTMKAWFKKSATGNVTIAPGYASFAETGSGNRTMLTFTASETAITLSATSAWTLIQSATSGIVAAEVDPNAEEYGYKVTMTSMAAGTLDIDDDESSIM